MSKSSAKTAITNVFKTNGQGSITGATSQSALTGMLDILYADLASAGIIANAYSASTTYAVGDYCIYNEALYRCTTTISTAEAWNASHWTTTTVATEIVSRASAISSHLANTSNPHSVTKAQVGLGNCDNTSDADKPISTATQSALDDKADADDVESALADKTDIDGSYPLMEVGSAINISGSDKVSAEVLFRTSGGTANIGSGTAKIDKYFGNSYAWNQLVQNGDTEQTNSTGTAWSQANYTTSAPVEANNHKYYIRAEVKGKTGSQFILAFTSNIGASSSSLSTTSWTTLETIGVKDSSGLTLSLFDVSGSGESSSMKNGQLFDLTLIFGAGYEPASVSALKATEIGAYICSGYHAYNAGGLLSFTGTGIKTTGFQQWDEQWGNVNGHAGSANYIPVVGGQSYYGHNIDNKAIFAFLYDSQYNRIYTNGVIRLDETPYTIPQDLNVAFIKFYLYQTTLPYSGNTCINISHSGRRNGEYEPYWASTLSFPITTATGKLNGAGSSVVPFADGFKSAGSARDEAWNEMVNGVNTGKARKRLAKVDLGTLDWVIITGTPNRFHISFAGAKRSNVTTLLSPFYRAGWANDKEIAVDDGGLLLIWDSAYSTAASFKAAMNGVYLIYELATPEEYVMDAPWSTNYRVDDWGTEEIVPSQGSAPTSAPAYYSVEYALNAKDELRNLGRNYMSCNPSESGNTLTAITSALLSKYGINITLTWDSANSKYNVTASGGWEPVASAPASASASGTKGQYYIDTNYLYIAVASNTWKRIALSTW